jgi:hypothetical protein
MVWDLLRFRHVRTLPEQSSPITALKIQPLTVLIFSVVVTMDDEWYV